MKKSASLLATIVASGLFTDNPMYDNLTERQMSKSKIAYINRTRQIEDIAEQRRKARLEQQQESKQ